MDKLITAVKAAYELNGVALQTSSGAATVTMMLYANFGELQYMLCIEIPKNTNPVEEIIEQCSALHALKEFGFSTTAINTAQMDSCVHGVHSKRYFYEAPQLFDELTRAIKNANVTVL